MFKMTQRPYLKNFVCITIISVLGGTGIYIYKNYISSPQQLKTHEVLKLHVDLTNQLIEQELQMKLLLLEDPKITAVKNGLKQIQDRVASLRTQTSQYEKMEQIPGGPTSFIKSSLEQLESITKIEVTQLQNDAISSLHEKSQRCKVLLKNCKELFTQAQKMTDEAVIQQMVRNELWLTPFSYENDEMEKLADNNFTTIDEAQEKMSTLATLYENQIELMEKAAVMLGYASYEDIHGEVPNTLTERLEVMEEEEVDAISEAMDTVILLGEKIQLMKKTYMKHFKVLWILKFRLIKNFSILMKRAETYEDEMRKPLTELQTMIVKDVFKLKIRIQNLKYKYAKKKPEL